MCTCSELCGILSVVQLALLWGDNIVVLCILAVAMFNFIQGIHGGNALYGTIEVTRQLFVEVELSNCLSFSKPDLC